MMSAPEKLLREAHPTHPKARNKNLLQGQSKRNRKEVLFWAHLPITQCVPFLSFVSKRALFRRAALIYGASLHGTNIAGGANWRRRRFSAEKRDPS